MSELALPDLIFYGPDCPFCGAECRYEEGWDCESCGFCWSSAGTHGERLSVIAGPDLPPCGAEISPWADSQDLVSELIRNNRYRCARDKDHDGECAGVRVDVPNTLDTYTWKG